MFNIASNVFGLVLQSLDALQDSEGAGVQAAAFGARGPEQLAKMDALEINKRELLDENQRLQI